MDGESTSITALAMPCVLPFLRELYWSQDLWPGLLCEQRADVVGDVLEQ
ncbi:MAG: hypothetical protein ACUVXA_07260 [Candidatus Jordarchaeum sp.]